MKEPLDRGVFGCWKVCEWVKDKGSDAVCVPASCALSPEPACVQLHSTHRVGWGLCGTWAAGRRGIASSRVQSGAGFLPISFRREMMFEVVLPWARLDSKCHGRCRSGPELEGGHPGKEP